MAVTIRDVARKAQVSPSTVSRYMNGKYESMSETTRIRLEQAVAELGYVPSTSARGLRTKRTYRIGVSIADISNPYSAEVLQHMGRFAAEASYSLLVEFSSNDPQAEAHSLRRLAASGIDALVINSCGANDALICELAERMPVVLLDRRLDSTTLDLVTSNTDPAMLHLVQHMHTHGAKRFMMIVDQVETSSVRRARQDAFYQLMQTMHLDHEVRELHKISDIPELVRNTTDDTGLLFVNGTTMMNFIEQAAPAQDLLSNHPLGTFDCFPWHQFMFGGIPSIKQQTDVIAHTIIDMLLVRIAKPHALIAPTEIAIEGKLVTFTD